MFRDLGRVHIVSFAVGIVGLVIGIVGIVLAIVFGTAQTTCTTPATPTCPPIPTQQCNTNLFGISTTVNNMKYDKAYDNVGGPEWLAAVQNITDTLTATLNTGLNPTSSSSFLRILAATGPASNNVKVDITKLAQDANGLVIAIGNGAVSAAAPLGTMPTATNVTSVINSNPTTYSNSSATPQVCQPTCQDCITCPTPTPTPDCPICTTQTPDCPVCTTQAPDCPVCTTPTPVQCTTAPVVTTKPTVPVVTTATNPPPQTTTPGTQTSSPAPVATTTNGATSTQKIVNTSTQPSAPSTAASTGTSQTTKGTPTPGTSSTAPVTTTQGSVTTTTTAPPPLSTTTLGQKTTQSVSSSPVPVPSTTQTRPTSTGSTSASPTPPASSPAPVPSTSTPSAKSTSTIPSSTVPSSAAPSSTTRVSTTTAVPPTIGPNQCYYQSNIAVAVELTDPSSPIDLKIQNFIANNLLFYPGNPYQLGKPGTGMTQLALVPYPTYKEIEDIMNYGVATTSQRITGLFYSLGIFAGPDPEINEALTFISNLTYEGSPGYVIIIGNNGTSITSSIPSSELLQQLGFTVITIGYQSTDDFSLLATNQGLSFKISQDSDELVIAQQIGNILNSTYCLKSQPSSAAPITSTQPPIGTSSSTRAPASSAATSSQPPGTTTIVTSATTPTPLPSTSSQPVPSSSMGTSSTAPGSSTLQQGVSSTPATLPTTTRGILSSTMNPTTSTQAPSSSSKSTPSPSSTRTFSTSTIASTTIQNIPSSSISPSPIPTTTNTFSTTTFASTSSQPTPSRSSSLSPVPSTSQPTPTGRSSTSSSPQPSSTNPSTSTKPISTSPAPVPTTTQSIPTSSGSQSTSSQSTTQTPSPSSSTKPTQSTSNNPLTSSPSHLTSSTLPVQSSTPSGSTASSAPSTLPPTIPPGVCYYQSNVAVAFELSTSADDIDLQIQNFIINDLFFYGGAPYDLGHMNDGKTEVSLVPYPNDDALAPIMAYGFANTPTEFGVLMNTFQTVALSGTSIADAFNVIPTNQRIGPPGFVILVANSAVTVQASIDSATKLQAQGFKIITVAFKSAGSFSVLSSDPSYNFQIHQDGDKHSVAMAIGNILNSTFCSPLVGSTTIGSTITPGSQSSTVTVPQVPTSSPAATSTVTVPNGSSTSMFRSSTTVSYTTTSGPTPTTCVCTTMEPGSTSPGYTTSKYATTMGSSSYSTATTPGMTPGSTTASTPGVTPGSTVVTSQLTTPGASSSMSTQQSTTPGASSSSPAQQSTVVTSSPVSSKSTATPGASSSSPAQRTSTPSMSSSFPSSQTSTPGATSSPSQQSSSTQKYSTSTPSGTGTTGTATTGTATTPAASSSPSPQSTASSVYSSTVTGPSTLPPTSGPTTSQICPNQQTVFSGQVGVIFELLPASAQQATINDFVENILLNSNYYGLAVDNLSQTNRTLATAIPYPSTDKYGVQGYGSARSLNDFKNEVIAFNGAIQPVTVTSDLTDALLYISTNLPAGGVKSALIIVGNNGSMIDATSQVLADQLKDTFDIYTVAVGDGAAADKFAPLSSGDGFSFIGNTQQVANQIGLKLATSNPAVYCPPPVPSTAAPITTTNSLSSVSPVTSTIAPTTTVTTVRPTVGPCQCTGRWVYNGDLAIAFEFVKNSQGSTNVTNFVSNTLLSNPDSYGLSNDVNGNQPSKLTVVAYPDTERYTDFKYGDIKKPSDIVNFIDAFALVQTANTDPAISDAFNYINTLTTDPYAKVVLLVASNGTDVAAAADSADKLKNAGYTVLTVAQTASADVFRPLASGDKYAFHIGDGNDNDVAAQIASLLLDISFVCYDDGSSTPSPITKCPGTQGTTQPDTVGTTPAPVVSSSTVGSTVVTQGSSTAGNAASTSLPVRTTQGSSTAPPSSTIGSTVSISSTMSAESTVTTPIGSSSTMGSTATVGSTVSSGSSTQGSSTVGNTESTTVGSTVTGPSTTAGSTVSIGSTTSGPSTMANTGSTTVGSTVTAGSTSTPGSTVSSGSTTTAPSTMANTGSTTVGSTVTQGSSTSVNTGSTSTPVQTSTGSSTVASTMTQTTGPSTSPLPSCPSPFKGKIATVFELNAVQPEIQDVVTFVSSNLYNTPNYDFSDSTQAINVPYGDTDQSAGNILQFGAAKSLGDLQANIANLFTNAPLTTNPTVSDGLIWINGNIDPPATDPKGIIIVVGNHDDDNNGLTYQYRDILRGQGYQFMSVSVGTGHGSLSSIADKPEWYFQVGDSNGQFVANQISSILCNL